MVYAIQFGKLQKIWAVIRGDAIFLLSLVCSAGLNTLYSRLFSHHAEFCSSITVVNKISSWVACVNRGKHP